MTTNNLIPTCLGIVMYRTMKNATYNIVVLNSVLEYHGTYCHARQFHRNECVLYEIRLLYSP